MRRTTFVVAVLLGLLASVLTPAGHASTTSRITASEKPVTPAAKAARKPVKGKTTALRVLGINDFHGQLEPPTGSGANIPTGATVSGTTTTTVNTVTGGAAYMATHLKRLQAGREATFVGSGDLIGASPLISGLLHDEPTIEALNTMGLDFAGVGNHEFDEGIDELLRMQYGGCKADDPENSCQGGAPFSGAFFKYLASNVRYVNTGDTIFPPYMVQKVRGTPGARGIKVAYIGSVLEDTPSVVTPEGVKGLAFDDEAETINKLVKKLSAEQGVEAFVVLIHQGGRQNAPYADGYVNRNKCENPTGDIFNITPKLSDRVDVVVSAHTHQQYVCEQDGKLVTSAASASRLITSIDLTLSRRTRDVVAKTAQNVLVTRDVPADPEIQALIAKYKAVTDPRANRVVGQATGPISRTNNAAGESALGDVIADSQLAATSAPDKGGAVVAFMNPGGIRADLVPAANGDVTYGQLFTVQPFGNTVTVKTLTGAQIERLLEQQFGNPTPAENRLLQVSRGFAYTYDLARPVGDRVDPTTITIGGTVVDPAASYRVAMNNFLASGGDGFTVFAEGTDQLGGEVDLDAFEAYLDANSPIAPGPQDRITKAP